MVKKKKKFNNTTFLFTKKHNKIQHVYTSLYLKPLLEK